MNKRKPESFLNLKEEQKQQKQEDDIKSDYSSSEEEEEDTNTLEEEYQQALKFFSSTQIAGFEEAFKLFDLDNSKTIDAEELQCVFQSLGQSRSIEEVEELLLSYDKNDDMEIDLREFIVLMYRTVVKGTELGNAVIHAVQKNFCGLTIERAFRELALNKKYKCIVLGVDPKTSVCYVESTILNSLLTYPVEFENRTYYVKGYRKKDKDGNIEHIDQSGDVFGKKKTLRQANRKIESAKKRKKKIKKSTKQRIRKKSINSKKHLTFIGDKLMLKILSFLGVSDLCKSLQLVNFEFFKLSNHPIIWELLYSKLMDKLNRRGRPFGKHVSYKEEYKKELFTYNWEDLVFYLPDDSCKLVIFHFEYSAHKEKRKKFIFLHWSPPLAPVEQETMCSNVKPEIFKTIKNTIGDSLQLRACDKKDLKKEKIIIKAIRDDQKRLVERIKFDRVHKSLY